MSGIKLNQLSQEVLNEIATGSVSEIQTPDDSVLTLPVVVKTGDSSGDDSGEVTIDTGSGNTSGLIRIQTGLSNVVGTGNIDITTGATGGGAAGKTGNLTIGTGDSGTGAASGDIILKTGSSFGPSQGKITLDDGTQQSDYVWTCINGTTGEGEWKTLPTIATNLVDLSDVNITPASGEDGKVITYNHSSGKFVLEQASVPISGWELAGNTGTDDTSDFIGTTDTQDVVFKAANTESFRIDKTTRDIIPESNSIDIGSFSKPFGYLYNKGVWVSNTAGTTRGIIAVQSNDDTLHVSGYNTGAGVVLESALSAGAGDSSGDVVVASGNGDVNSGDVVIQTGTISSGTRGKIALNDGTQVNNYVWTCIDGTTGEGEWKVAPETGASVSYVDAGDAINKTYSDTHIAGTDTIISPSSGDDQKVVTYDHASTSFILQTVSGTGDFLANGTVAMTDNLNLNSNDLINVNNISANSGTSSIGADGLEFQEVWTNSIKSSNGISLVPDSGQVIKFENSSAAVDSVWTCTNVDGSGEWKVLTGSGDFLANGTVAMTDNLNLDSNDLINVGNITSQNDLTISRDSKDAIKIEVATNTYSANTHNFAGRSATFPNSTGLAMIIGSGLSTLKTTSSGIFNIETDGGDFNTSPINVKSGDAGPSNELSGNVSIHSGTSTTNRTGDVSLYSGEGTGNAASSGVITGNVNVYSGARAGGAGPTGNVSIYSGAHSGSGNSGNISIATGTSDFGTRGSISLDATNVDVAGNSLTVGSTGYQTGSLLEISATATDVRVITRNATTHKFMVIEYSLERNGHVRTGRLMTTTNGSTVHHTNDYVESDDINLSFSSVLDTGSVGIEVTDTGGTGTIDFKYSIRYWS